MVCAVYPSNLGDIFKPNYLFLLQKSDQDRIKIDRLRTWSSAKKSFNNEVNETPYFAGAHKMSAVSALSWRTNNELASAGHDACVKLWNISF